MLAAIQPRGRRSIAEGKPIGGFPFRGYPTGAKETRLQLDELIGGQVLIDTIRIHTGDKTEVEAGLKINTYESFLKNTKNILQIMVLGKENQKYQITLEIVF